MATRRRTTPSHPVVVDSAPIHRRRGRGRGAQHHGGKHVTRRHDRDWRPAARNQTKWSCRQTAMRCVRPSGLPRVVGRRLPARPETHAPATPSERCAAGTLGETTRAIWSGDESVAQTVCPSASPGDVDRRLLPSQKAQTPPTVRRAASTTATRRHRRISDPVEWAGCQPARRTVSWRAGQVRAFRWQPTLGAPADHDGGLWVSGSSSVTRNEGRERVTTTTQIEEAVA